MKSRTTIKARLLALVLTVLMTVGVLPFSVFAVGDEVNTNGKLDTENALFRAPTGDQISQKLGEDLLYYNSFDSYTDGLKAWTTYSTGGEGVGSVIPGGSGVVILPVDDGNDGLAMQYQGGVQMYFAWNYGKRSEQDTALSGKSFTFSADFKLGEDLKQGNLICLQSSVQGSDIVHFTAIPVWVDAAGNLYNGQVTSTITGSKSNKSITEGTLWQQNDINVEGATFLTADKKIGALSADKFTNVAVSVDVAKNSYTIYIDGIAVAENQTFASEAMLEYYKAVDKQNNDTIDYANGFGVTAISLGYRGSTTAGKTSLIFDNWLVYLGDFVDFNDFNDKKYDSSISADDFKVPNAADIKKSYKSDASYWQKFETKVTDSGNGTSDNGDGSWTLSMTDNAQYLVTYSSTNVPAIKQMWEKGLGGVDVATSFELTLDNSSTVGGIGKICAWMPVTESRGTAYSIIMVTPVEKNGAKVFQLAWPNAAGNAASAVFAEIPADKKVKVDIIFDLSMSNDMYYVFIDDEYVGGNSIFNGKTGSLDKITYQTDLINSFRDVEPDKAVSDGIIFDGLRFYSGQAVQMVVGNLNMYHYDDNADDNLLNNESKTNVILPALYHYQDFNALTLGAYSDNTPSLLDGKIEATLTSGITVIDDGRGDKALTATDTAYYEVKPNAATGTNFVTSTDIKIVGNFSSPICLFNGCAVDINSNGDDFNLAMVYLKPNGELWIATKTDDTSSGTLVNFDGDVTPYLTKKIGFVSTATFTNVAVAVNVAENTYTVYVNGVDMTGKLQFLTDTDLAYLKAATNTAGELTFPNGFGLTHVRFNMTSYLAYDNIAVYESGDILFNKINRNPINGYFKVGNNYFYYDNGQIVTGDDTGDYTSADGLITIGEDGVVMSEEVVVTDMRLIYKYVGNDVVPVDGKYKGIYSYTKSGTKYFYGEDKKLIKNKNIDIADAGFTTDLTEATGYATNEKGQSTLLNGLNKVDGGKTYFYVNGIRATGFLKDDNGVYFIFIKDDNYTIFAGQMTLDGKTYYFDDTTHKGELLNGICVDYEDTNTPDKYYIDGVYQTGLIDANGTKYFADATGVLKTAICTVNGNDYYFYESGENKYEMAVGVSIIYNGSIIKIGDDGVINSEDDSIDGQWSEVDGVWYYSDASGNLQSGLAYIEKSFDGKAGGHYYFDNGLMIKDAFIEVYGTVMYFGKDGIAPTGIVFVEYTAAGFPVNSSVSGDGEYFHFIDGSLAKGETTIIHGAYKYSFENGRNVGKQTVEYLVVLDADGKVIERVEIVNGEILVDGVKVADADSDVDNDRIEMLSHSKKICGYAEYAEWRVDDTTLDKVEETSMHNFDLTKKYTTSNIIDPLYGYHYYLCQTCGKAAGITEHTYTDNGDGTHTANCECIYEETGLPYSEKFACEYVGKYDENGHWSECKLCGAIKDAANHTLVDGNDDVYHYLTCDCGYQIEHNMTRVEHKDSTCREQGHTEYMDCDECDYISGKVILPMLPHNLDGRYASDATGHWYACKNEQCEVRYYFSEHNYITVPELAAGCTTNGHNEYQLCTECGYENGKVVESAPGHDVVDVPYSFDDTNHWQICKKCGDRVIEAHSFGSVIDSEEGTKACGICLKEVNFKEQTWWHILGFNRVEIEDHYYYKYAYGDVKDRFIEIGGVNYYFDENGYLVKAQALTIVDTIYVFDANGALVKNESNYECNGVYYVIDADGKATVKDEDDGE